MPRVLLALGSNLGDRGAQLEAAVKAISDLPSTKSLAQSTWHATRPVGGPPEQGDFLNGAVLIETSLEPAELRAELQRVERELGRKRSQRWAARALDIDILLCDDSVIDEPDLQIPHPRMSFRPFVLAPAKEIASDMIHPVLGVSIGALWHHLEHAEDVVVFSGGTADDRRKLVELLLSRFSSDSECVPNVVQSEWLDRPTLRITRGTLTCDTRSHRPKLQLHLSVEKTTQNALSLPIAGVPTLVLDPRDDPTDLLTEAAAALEALWPDLCRHSP